MSRPILRSVSLGITAGFAIGYVAWSGTQVVGRRALFNRSPLRRLAALGYLSGQPSAQNARLLRDYVHWEQRPDLQRRASRVLARMERRLA